MLLIQEPVGVTRPHLGAAAINRPKDVHALARKLEAIGYLEPGDLSRSNEALHSDLPTPLQSGYFNRERIVEVYDRHDYGCSWLAELIQDAGESYRKAHLRKFSDANQTAVALDKRPSLPALITLNDASLPMGGASPDHRGHQTGLAVDVLLPRNDGTVRRSPEPIDSGSDLYDRAAMHAMLKAFTDTGRVQSLFFQDDQPPPGTTPLPACKRHAQIQVKVPSSPVDVKTPNGITAADALKPENVAAIRDRFEELGFAWVREEKVTVGQHIHAAKQPIREGGRYAVKAITPSGLDWTIRLFKAIVAGKLIVDPTAEVKLSEDEYKMLFAANAPRWVRMPVGTIEVTARLVEAIRIVQAVVAGELTTANSTGCLHPHDRVADLLERDEVPHFEPLRGGGKYVIADPGSQFRRRQRTNVPKPCLDLLIDAADKYDTARSGHADWKDLRVLHPGADHPDGGSETGLRLRIVTDDQPDEARMAIRKSFADAGADVGAEDAAKRYEVRLKKKEFTTKVTVSDRDAVFISPPQEPSKPGGDTRSLVQTPRLGLIVNGGNVTAIAWQIQRPFPKADGTFGYEPLVFEWQLETPFAAGTLGLAPSEEGTSAMQPAKGMEGDRRVIKLNKSKINTIPKDTEWKLKPVTFGAGGSFIKPDFAVAAPAEFKLRFKNDYAWNGTDAVAAAAGPELVCEFGGGLLAQPVSVAVPLTAVSLRYETAPEGHRRPPRVDTQRTESFDPAGKDDPTDLADEAAAMDAGGHRRLFEGWRISFPLGNGFAPDLPQLGIKAEMKGSFDLLLAPDGALAVSLRGRLDAGLDLALGSGMVRLRTNGNTDVIAEIGTLGISLTMGKLPKVTLELDPFKHIPLNGRIAAIANAFGGASTARLISIELFGGDAADAPPVTIGWGIAGPRFSMGLLEKLFDPKAIAKPPKAINEGRTLSSMAGRLLGTSTDSKLAFKKIAGDCSFNRVAAKNNDGEDCEEWRLTVPIGVLVNNGNDPVLEGDCQLKFVTTIQPQSGFHAFDGASFSCTADNVLTVSRPEGFHSQFGELISLHIPPKSAFHFKLDPMAPELEWLPQPPAPGVEPQPISIRVPAMEGVKRYSAAANASAAEKKEALVERDKAPDNKNFAFDIDTFRLHSGGLNLHAGVRVNQPKLGASSAVVFAEPLQVHPAEGKAAGSGPRVGEFEVRNGRLVAASLRATGKLPFFDNATGTLGLVVTEDADTIKPKLNCLGTFDVTGCEKFDIAALYAQCVLRALHLETTYDGGWKSKGEITGSVKFTPPEGKSPGDTGPLAELFQGVTVEFEDLDLLNLATGTGKISVQCPPKTFSFGEILKIDLRGIDMHLGGKTIGNDTIAFPEQFGLLGDVTLQRLPGVNSSLTFGGITLRPGTPPGFSVQRIGGQITTAGFRMEGVLDHIDTPEEVGFAGAFGVTMDSFPRINGVIKLTRIRAGDGRFVPTFALFLEADVKIALFAGFFLKRIGAGLGLRQGLVGLIDDGTPMTQRILKLVDNPAGLPQPTSLDAWKAIPPKTASAPMDWMFVASGLITFGDLAADKPHTFAGGMLLAIDQALNITLAANAWLFTSPNETRDAEFQRRPVVRGAISLSLRERRLFAYFKTLRNPKMGEQTPPLLADILKNGETSLMLAVNRDGFIMEIGWPWETRLQRDFGPLKGELTAGFRFGIYRGNLITGLNFAINVSLDARESFGAGPGELQLVAHGNAYFRAQFLGAVTRSMKMLLKGDIAFGATLKLSATLRWEIGFRIAGKKYSRSFSASAHLDLSIHAALDAAMDDRGNVGFRGAADIAFSIGGFRVDGTAHFGHNEGLIDEVGQKLQALMPPNIRSFGLDGGKPVADGRWQYRYVRIGNKVRVLFFPAPGNSYPKLVDGNPRYSIKLTDKAKFHGFVGGVKVDPVVDVLAWTEKLDEVIIREEAALAGLSEAEKIEIRNKATAEEKAHLAAVTLKDILAKQPASQGRPILAGRETRDERTRVHGAARADDESHAIADADVRSPNLPRDHNYDEAVREARDSATRLRRLVFDSRALQTEDLALTATPQYAGQVGTQVSGVSNVWQWNADKLTIFAVRPDATLKTVKFHEGLAPGVAAAILNAWAKDNAGLEALKKTIAAVFRFPVKYTVIDVAPVHRPDASPPVWEIDVESKNEANETVKQVVRVSTAADGRVAVELAPQQSTETLDPGLVLHELLAFLRDPRGVAGTPWKDASASNPDLPKYTLAPHLNLVLEFDDVPNPEKFPDPVPQLLNLAACTFLSDKDKPNLDAVVPLRNNVLPEYDLVVENVFQSREQIALAWTLEPEGADRREPGFDFCRELEHITVTRVHRTGTSLEPKVMTLYPAWLRKNDELIRPQFQYVDDDARAVPDGELVDYSIEARSVDRVLARCEITVTRKYVEPLASPAQSLVVQTLAIGAPEPQTLTFAVRLPDDARPEEVCLRYRAVPASTVGAYGIDPPVAAGVSYDTPAGQNHLRFVDASAQRPLPWSQTDPVEKVEFKRIEDGSSTAIVVLTLRDGKLNGLTWQKGVAFEFHIGLERAPEGGRPLRRSPLTRCRHSVLPRILTATDKFFADSAEAPPVALGNVVQAIEWVPMAADDEPRLADRLQATIASKPAPKVSDEKIPTLRTIELHWRHELTGRDGFDQPAIGNFDPVIGYTLESFDLFGPEHYDHDNKLRVRTVQQQSLRTMPEAIYRATPDSIEVIGLRTEQGPRAETIDEAVTRRLKDSVPAAQPAQWKRLPEDAEFTKVSPAAGTYELVKPEEPIEWPGGPVWLEGTLLKAIHTLLTLDPLKGGRCRLSLQRPLVDRVPDSDATIDDAIKEFPDRFLRLTEDLDALHDPFGWLALEAFGFSCECHFITAGNRPLRVEDLLDSIPDLGGVGLCAFVAEDGHMKLNVLRLFVGAPASIAMNTRAAILQIAGRMTIDNAKVETFWKDESLSGFDNAVKKTFDLDKIKKWRDALPVALKNAGCIDSANSKYSPVSLYREDARYGMDDAAEKQKAPPRSAPTLPIDRFGGVAYSFAVPDNWAHHYAFALRPERRYDALRAASRPRPTTTDSPPLKSLAGWTQVPVPRDRPLVPPKLVATPLPGAVQFLALRHPAEFAANATADNMARIQFQGVTYHWPQRKIPAEFGTWDTLQVAGATFDWKVAYKTFVEAKLLKKENETAKPVPLNHGLLNEVIPGTATGIYGVDRFVVPDLPAWYEYRTRATVAAGDAAQASEYTAWVRPLLESYGASDRRLSDAEPQVPRVSPAAVVQVSGNKLKLTQRLSLLRDLMTPAFRRLWSASELPYKETGIPLGFLPDLAMRYRILFRTDGFPKLADEDPKGYVPVFRILGEVILKPEQPEMVTPLVDGVSNATVKYAFDAETGLSLAMEFDIAPGTAGFPFTNRLTELPKLAGWAKDTPKFRRLIAVQGIRQGVLSQIMEHTTQETA